MLMRQSITDLQQQIINLTNAFQQWRTDVQPVCNDEFDSDESHANPFGIRRDNPVLEHENNRWESVFKLEVPGFYGTANTEELLDWLVTVEEILEFKRVPLDLCAALIASHFLGRAAAWWKQLKSSRERSGKQKIIAWNLLQNQMKKTFLPFNYDQVMFQKLQNLRQDNRSIEEYSTEFFFMINRIDLQDSESQVIAGFIGGLRQQIQHTLNLLIL